MKQHARVAFAALAITLGVGESLPTEFRLFQGGWNDTEKGRFLFDADAAASVMAAYKAWGVDLMIDLEHQSLDADTPNEPTARDARGWFRLELREDGSLWAVSVTWTPDGEARLREKRQRYVSPAFSYDAETGRILKILNVAITGMPATHDTPALVAASARVRDLRKLSTGVSFDDVRRALSAALSAKYPQPAPQDPCAPRDGPWIVDVFDATFVFELEGKLYEATYTISGDVASLGAPVEVRRTYAPSTAAPTPAAAANRFTAALAIGGQMDPKLVQEALDALIAGDSAKCAEILKGIVVAAAGGQIEAEDEQDPAAGAPAAAAGANADNAPPDPKASPDAKKKDGAPMAAAGARAMKLTGKSDPNEAFEELERRSKIALEVEEREAKLAADAKKLESAERRSLVATLVKLNVEIPAFAWADPLKQPLEPCKRLAEEPIAELRKRVHALASARGVTVQEPTPPASTTATEYGELTTEQLRICKETGCSPEDFARVRALHTAPITP